MPDDDPLRQPTDDEIVAGVRSAKPADWRELRRLLDVVEHEPPTTGWGGGPFPEPGDPRPQIIQWPYPEYAESVLALEQLLYAMNAIVPFPWPDWLSSTA